MGILVVERDCATRRLDAFRNISRPVVSEALDHGNMAGIGETCMAGCEVGVERNGAAETVLRSYVVLAGIAK